jgi:hypothetical protein
MGRDTNIIARLPRKPSWHPLRDRGPHLHPHRRRPVPTRTLPRLRGDCGQAGAAGEFGGGELRGREIGLGAAGNVGASDMSTDWSTRTAAIEYFEKLVKQFKKTRDEDTEIYEAALSALRRSQDHTAIQSKLQRTLKALGVYKDCRHACIDCFCTKEARAELSE